MYAIISMLIIFQWGQMGSKKSQALHVYSWQVLQVWNLKSILLVPWSIFSSNSILPNSTWVQLYMCFTYSLLSLLPSIGVAH